MPMSIQEVYFKTDKEWRNWLFKNHDRVNGIYIILYKVDHEKDSMRWEEAVRVALCFGWIDSTAKSLGDGKRRQYFTPRNPKSVWSALNKRHIKDLLALDLMHESGLAKIEIAKQNGSWIALDDVENGIIPPDLELAFNKAPKAFTNYQS